MLFSVEQAFVGRDKIQAPLKLPACEASTGEIVLFIWDVVLTFESVDEIL